METWRTPRQLAPPGAYGFSFATASASMISAHEILGFGLLTDAPAGIPDRSFVTGERPLMPSCRARAPVQSLWEGWN